MEVVVAPVEGLALLKANASKYCNENDRPESDELLTLNAFSWDMTHNLYTRKNDAREKANLPQECIVLHKGESRPSVC